jgi:AAA+ superfamily predicted ATPase
VTGFEELAERLRRVDVIVALAIRRQQSRRATQSKGNYWGTLVTDQEVIELLQNHGEIDLATPDSTTAEQQLATTLMLRDRPGGRIGGLREAFDLDGDDIDLLLLALAPEISAGYGRMYAYLNDSLNQAYLTVDLATRVLRSDRNRRMALQTRLMPSSPLIRFRLLLLHPSAENVEAYASKRVYPSPRLLRWLLDDEGLPNSVGVDRVETARDPFVPTGVRDRLEALEGALQGPTTACLVGGTRGGREGTAIRIARQLGRPLLQIDLDHAKPIMDQPFDLIRDLRLSGAIPLLTNLSDVQEDPAHRTRFLGLGKALESLPHLVLTSGASQSGVRSFLGADRSLVTIRMERGTKDERLQAWSSAFTERGWQPTLAPDLAERFYSLTGTTIPAVLDRATAECGGREPAPSALWAAARERSRPVFRGLATQIIPTYSWSDLILNERTMKQLRHLVTYMAEQEAVYHGWGMSKVRPRGYGIKALFTGSPGTGKTMCAEVIAGSLGLDLFRVDLSSVISRWVGETEKNLREIFDAAEGGNSVLLFDEADALFGNRGEVKQAQDRFANQEVSFLLQRLETFEGCALLTSNLQENIDDAFLRRFGAVVEFPMPSPAQRELLWQRAFSDAVPRAPDLDIAYLANQFTLAGGSIVNAAINASIIASNDNRPVSMRHAIVAVGRELVKMGKQVNRAFFGEYYDLVSDL